MTPDQAAHLAQRLSQAATRIASDLRIDPDDVDLKVTVSLNPAPELITITLHR